MPIGEFSRRTGVSSKHRKPRIGQRDCRCGTRQVPQGQLATLLPGAGVVAVLGGRRAADGRDDLRRCESVLDLRVWLRHGRAGLGEALAGRLISHGPASRALPVSWPAGVGRRRPHLFPVGREPALSSPAQDCRISPALQSRCKRSGTPHGLSSSANVASRGEAAVAAGATPCLLRLVPSGREQTGARA